MAIVLAVQWWRHYLLGKSFTVFTGQKSLKFLLDQKLGGEEQQKWLSKLMGYNFEIKYKAGLENRVADALSRRFHFSAISVISIAEWGELEDEVMTDVKLNAIMQRLICGEEGAVGFSLKNGRLLYKGRLVITRTSKWIRRSLRNFMGLSSEVILDFSL